MKKNKKEEKLELKPFAHQEEEVFSIFQMPVTDISLRKEKEAFKPSEAVSPMEGRYASDKTVFPEADLHEDIDQAYDKYRVNPILTDEDEIKRHGMKYHEFPDISKHLEGKSTDYDKVIEEKPEEKPEVLGFDFGVIDINKNEEKPEQLFNRDIKEEKKDELSTLTYEELHVFENKEEVAPRILSEDDKEERTIILGKRDFSHDDDEDDNLDNHKNDFEPSLSDIPEPKEEPIIDDIPDLVNMKEEDIPTTIISSNKEDNSLQFEPIEEIKEEIKEDNNLEPVIEQKQEKKEEKKEARILRKDLYANYKYPDLSLLDPLNAANVKIPDVVNDQVEIINKTLSDFGIDGKVDTYTYGPQVTRFEVALAPGIMVNKVTKIEDNLKKDLRALSIRIEAPIPGKSNIGIEVPNPKVRTVQFIELLDTDEFRDHSKPLKVALGLNIDGEPIYSDIAKMPHGLVAGQTGSGKSVCINALLLSLLYKNTPDDLKMILVDPKQVELANYADLPHLITPVITDPKLANEALKWACEEMDRRYKAFPLFRAREIVTYNERIKSDKTLKKLPYIVIFVDELADLMMTCGGDVEDSIKRITQLGRAAGIHLIIATQRPTTDIVKGTIKANIPTRLAFSVKQYTDSITILDQVGAETLLGKGDMLYQTVGAPVRLQAPYVTDDEIYRITDFIRSNYGPDYEFTHEELQEKTKEAYGANSSKQDDEDMELIANIALEIAESGNCSINALQKQFKLGFNRGQKIVEILEEMGIVSPKKGTTGREVLVDVEQVKQIFDIKD